MGGSISAAVCSGELRSFERPSLAACGDEGALRTFVLSQAPATLSVPLSSAAHRDRSMPR